MKRTYLILVLCMFLPSLHGCLSHLYMNGEAQVDVDPVPPQSGEVDTKE